MFNNSTGFTMPVVPQSYSGGMFGGDGSWFIWFFLLIILFGWGNGGFNGGGTQTAVGALDQYALSSDFATLSRQVDSTTSALETKMDIVNGAITSGIYENAQLANGVNQSVISGNYELQNAITNSRISSMQDTNSLTAQITALGNQLGANACDIRYEDATNFAALNYNLASQACDLSRSLEATQLAIIENNNFNYRALNDRITSLEIDAKNDKIDALSAQLAEAKAVANNAAQTAYISSALNDVVSQLQPKTPIPAFTVPNPFASYYSGGGCNC